MITFLRNILIDAWLFVSACLTIHGCTSQPSVDNIQGGDRMRNVPLPRLNIEMLEDDIDFVHDNQSYKANVYVQYADSADTVCARGKLHSRGNGTYFYADEYGGGKLSYTLETKELIKLPELPETDHFCLLGNIFDETYLHNAFTFSLAHAINFPAPYYFFVELYINNQYRGLYQITDKPAIRMLGPKQEYDLAEELKRINPNKWRKYAPFESGIQGMPGHKKGIAWDTTPDPSSGYYMLDNTFGRYHKARSGFISQGGDRIGIRSPKYASSEMVEYVAEKYNEAEIAVMSENGINPNTGKHYSEYYDVNSFAKYYLLQEYIYNYDAGYGSFFMYLSAGPNSKIFAGPMWDADGGMNVWISRYSDGEINQLFAAGLFCDDKLNNTTRNLLFHFRKHDDFRALTDSIWFTELSPILPMLISNFFNQRANLPLSAIESDRRLYANSKLYGNEIWIEAISEMKVWLLYRKEALDRLFLMEQHPDDYIRVDIFTHSSRERVVTMWDYPDNGIKLPTRIYNNPISNEYKKHRLVGYLSKSSGNLYKVEDVIYKNDTLYEQYEYTLHHRLRKMSSYNYWKHKIFNR